jgi:hypothetical protein
MRSPQAHQIVPYLIHQHRGMIVGCELVLFRTSTVTSDTNLIVGNMSRCFRTFTVMSNTEVSWCVNRQALLPLGTALCARQGLTGLEQVGKPCVGPA